MLRYTHFKIWIRIISSVLSCALLLSDAPSYAITDASRDFALAPPLATKPPCEIVRNDDGSFDVVTNNITASGKVFRNRWAFVDVSYLISQMLILTEEHKLHNPKDILKPLIKKHIRNRNGEAEMLLERYAIDGIEELREDGEIKGFSLPVTRNGTTAYRLVYNLQGGDITIPMRDERKVYVKIERPDSERSRASASGVTDEENWGFPADGKQPDLRSVTIKGFEDREVIVLSGRHRDPKLLRLFNEEVIRQITQPENTLFLVESGEIQAVVEEVKAAQKFAKENNIPLYDQMILGSGSYLIEQIVSKYSVIREDLYGYFTAARAGVLGIEQLEDIIQEDALIWNAPQASIVQGVMSWVTLGTIHESMFDKKFAQYRTWVNQISNQVSSQVLRYYLRTNPERKKIFVYLGGDHREIFQDIELPESERLTDKQIEQIIQDQRKAYQRVLSKLPTAEGEQSEPATGRTSTSGSESRDAEVRKFNATSLPDFKRRIGIENSIVDRDISVSEFQQILEKLAAEDGIKLSFIRWSPVAYHKYMWESLRYALNQKRWDIFPWLFLGPSFSREADLAYSRRGLEEIVVPQYNPTILDLLVGIALVISFISGNWIGFGVGLFYFLWVYPFRWTVTHFFVNGELHELLHVYQYLILNRLSKKADLGSFEQLYERLSLLPGNPFEKTLSPFRRQKLVSQTMLQKFEDDFISAVLTSQITSSISRRAEVREQTPEKKGNARASTSGGEGQGDKVNQTSVNQRPELIPRVIEYITNFVRYRYLRESAFDPRLAWARGLFEDDAHDVIDIFGDFPVYVTAESNEASHIVKIRFGDKEPETLLRGILSQPSMRVPDTYNSKLVTIFEMDKRQEGITAVYLPTGLAGETSGTKRYIKLEALACTREGNIVPLDMGMFSWATLDRYSSHRVILRSTLVSLSAVSGAWPTDEAIDARASTSGSQGHDAEVRSKSVEVLLFELLRERQLLERAGLTPLELDQLEYVVKQLVAEGRIKIVDHVSSDDLFIIKVEDKNLWINREALDEFGDLEAKAWLLHELVHLLPEDSRRLNEVYDWHRSAFRYLDRTTKTYREMAAARYTPDDRGRNYRHALNHLMYTKITSEAKAYRIQIFYLQLSGVDNIADYWKLLGTQSKMNALQETYRFLPNFLNQEGKVDEKKFHIHLIYSPSITRYWDLAYHRLILFFEKNGHAGNWETETEYEDALWEWLTSYQDPREKASTRAESREQTPEEKGNARTSTSGSEGRGAEMRSSEKESQEELSDQDILEGLKTVRFYKDPTLVRTVRPFSFTRISQVFVVGELGMDGEHVMIEDDSKDADYLAEKLKSLQEKGRIQNLKLDITTDGLLKTENVRIFEFLYTNTAGKQTRQRIIFFAEHIPVLHDDWRLNERTPLKDTQWFRYLSARHVDLMVGEDWSGPDVALALEWVSRSFDENSVVVMKKYGADPDFQLIHEYEVAHLQPWHPLRKKIGIYNHIIPHKRSLIKGVLGKALRFLADQLTSNEEWTQKKRKEFYNGLYQLDDDLPVYRDVFEEDAETLAVINELAPILHRMLNSNQEFWQSMPELNQLLKRDSVTALFPTRAEARSIKDLTLGSVVPIEKILPNNVTIYHRTWVGILRSVIMSQAPGSLAAKSLFALDPSNAIAIGEMWQGRKEAKYTNPITLAFDVQRLSKSGIRFTPSFRLKIDLTTNASEPPKQRIIDLSSVDAVPLSALTDQSKKELVQELLRLSEKDDEWQIDRNKLSIALGFIDWDQLMTSLFPDGNFSFREDTFPRAEVREQTPEEKGNARASTSGSEGRSVEPASSLDVNIERRHATGFQDAINYIEVKSQDQPLIVALGTSWITGYEKGRYLQYDALNPLISNLRNHLHFIVGDDKSLLAEIKKKMSEQGFANARVMVLAGEETIKRELADLHNKENILLFGVDNRNLTVDSYVRLMEMLKIAASFAINPDIPPESPNIHIEKRGNFWIFIPRAEPMNYEELRMIYEVQKFA